MALDRTSGFDMLVQISEIELNNQVATAFLAGALFPAAMRVPVNAAGLAGTADLNFATPTIDLDRPRPSLGLSLPFLNSQFQVTAPAATTLAPLGGAITVVDRIEMVTEGSNQLATMDFTNGAPDVTVSFDAASQALLAPALAASGLTLAQAENLLAGAIVRQLQDDVRRLDLTPPIPVVDDSDPATPFAIDVTTVNDTTAADRDCLTFGLRTASDSGGNINGVNASFIPAGSQSLLMMSNFWLLARVMRPRVATALGLVPTDFDTPLRLNRNVPAPGGRGTLTQLEARVIDNRIRVDGRARASGTGWSAVSTFNFFIDIGLSAGSLTVIASTPSVDTDIDLEWWVWLVSLGLGGLFGGIIGVIVAAIVVAIVEAVAEGIVSNLVSGGIGGALGGIPSLPLGPIGSGLTLTGVVLDDLELRCSIVRSLNVGVISHGEHGSFAGFALDVDTGAIGSARESGSDLVWDPASGFSTAGTARLAITGASFGALTPVQISRMSLAGQSIPASLVPLTLDPLFPFLSADDVVFGMRTNEGRYAKVRAWRSLSEGGALHLEWVTYDTPTARLDIAGRWSVLERGDLTEYITPDCQFCRSWPVRWCGVFEAWPQLMVFPIDYQWCLCGRVIAEGEGTVPSPYGPLSYTLAGRRLVVEGEIGQVIDCELCVSVIDARGAELFTCTRLAKPGTETRCRRCVPRLHLSRIEVLPAPRELATWRRLLPRELPTSNY